MKSLKSLFLTILIVPLAVQCAEKSSHGSVEQKKSAAAKKTAEIEMARQFLQAMLFDQPVTTLEKVIQAKADVNISFPRHIGILNYPSHSIKTEKWTPLFEAIFRNNPDKVACLLSHKADVDHRVNMHLSLADGCIVMSRTPLLWTCDTAENIKHRAHISDKNCLEIAMLLINAGAAEETFQRWSDFNKTLQKHSKALLKKHQWLHTKIKIIEFITSCSSLPKPLISLIANYYSHIPFESELRQSNIIKIA